jgi:rhodanese-related sulfurtransferase
MRKWLSGLTLNQKLAVAAFALGLVAVAARPVAHNGLMLNARAMDTLVAKGIDRVQPMDLADWIIKGQGGFRLVDLQSPADYTKYHIPGAENVSVDAIESYPLLRSERVILYARDDMRAAEAWYRLKARGYRGVYALEGGLDGWMSTVLFPGLAEHPTPEQQRTNDRLRAVSAFFGGTPHMGGATVVAAEARELPKVAVPTLAASARPVKRKKKEGC